MFVSHGIFDGSPALDCFRDCCVSDQAHLSDNIGQQSVYGLTAALPGTLRGGRR